MTRNGDMYPHKYPEGDTKEEFLQAVCKAYLNGKTTDLTEREAMIAHLAGYDVEVRFIDDEGFYITPWNLREQSTGTEYRIKPEPKKPEKIERLRLDETNLTAQDYNKINQLIDSHNRLLEERV